MLICQFFRSLRTIREKTEEKIDVPTVNFVWIIIQRNLLALKETDLFIPRTMCMYVTNQIALQTSHCAARYSCPRASLNIHHFEKYF
jgi:hypothetical protein